MPTKRQTIKSSIEPLIKTAPAVRRVYVNRVDPVEPGDAFPVVLVKFGDDVLDYEGAALGRVNVMIPVAVSILTKIGTDPETVLGQITPILIDGLESSGVVDYALRASIEDDPDFMVPSGYLAVHTAFNLYFETSRTGV